MANNLLSRKHYCEETIFDKIDTPSKAYWLGVLYADGYVDMRGYYTVLETKDLDWLEQFKSFMKSEHTIYKGNGTHILSIGSKYLNSSLQQYGVIPNKTYDHNIDVYVPEKELESHFWRGAMDGDGCIGYYPTVKNIHQRCRVILTNINMNFLLKIQNFFKNNYNIPSYIALKHSKNSQYYHWSYGPRPAYLTKILLDILYKDFTFDICLKRKYNKYLEVLDAAKELEYIQKKPRLKISN